MGLLKDDVCQDLIRKISAFFDNPKKAEELIRGRYEDSFVICEDGSRIYLLTMYTDHLKMYNNRVRSKTPHSMDILKRVLRGTKVYRGAFAGSLKEFRNLDKQNHLEQTG